jgi:hypothetical protein
MRTAARSFRLTSWLALFAMALNALWPLLANAQPATAPAQVEICTAAGLQLPGDGHAPLDDARRHLQPHCALCSMGADKVPAAVGALDWSVAPAAPSGGRIASAVLPQPPHTHPTPAQPRAPPRLS